MELRVYDMRINEFDETGVDINSFVDAPAHMRIFDTYGKKKVNFAINEEKRIVTGVFILANFLIYRRDEQLGEHYVKFSPEEIWKIRNKFFKNKYNVNTNVQHATMVEGAILVDSYIVHSTDPRFPKVPEILAKQKVNDGSWVGSYYIENEALWQDCKNGIFKGFSVEGYFDKVQIKIKTNMKNNKKTSFFKNIFGADNVPEAMSDVTTVDGIVLSYEGDLAVGTAMMIDAEGQPIAATEGDHQIEVDGKTYAISLDAEGVITSMEEVTAMSEEAEILSQAIKKVVADATAQFSSMQKEIDGLKETLKAVQAGESFKAKGKKSEETEKIGFKKLV